MLAVFSAGRSAGAEAAPLVGAELKEAISGRTVMMSMSLGSMPITYRPNGTMKASSYAVGVVTGVSTDTGRWWVSGNNLCQRWNKWFDGQQFCHAMSKAGSKLLWVRDDGLSGSAKVIQ